jgi:RNA polymerase sigma factor (sigma-70 family)
MQNATITTIEPSAAVVSHEARIVPFDDRAWASAPRTQQAARCEESGELTWQEIFSRLLIDKEDELAFRALQRRVTRWADRQLTTPVAVRELREDVVADACAASILGIEHAYGSETFSGFVFGQFLSARRRCLRFSRLETVPLEDVQLAVGLEQGPDVDELALLERCLLELPPRERQAVEMRYFGDASSTEIARALDVSETNARRIVFNGLKRLRCSAHRVWPCGREGSIASPDHQL